MNFQDLKKEVRESFRRVSSEEYFDQQVAKKKVIYRDMFLAYMEKNSSNNFRKFHLWIYANFPPFPITQSEMMEVGIAVTALDAIEEEMNTHYVKHLVNQL